MFFCRVTHLVIKQLGNEAIGICKQSRSILRGCRPLTETKSERDVKPLLILKMFSATSLETVLGIVPCNRE